MRRIRRAWLVCCWGLVMGPVWLAHAQLEFNYADFTDVTGLVLRNDATAADGLIRLTASQPGRSGTVNFGGALPLRGGFTTEFRFRMRNPAGVLDADGRAGGEGMALIIQKQGAEVTGNAVLYMPYSIPDAVAVELDTWRNLALGDPDGNHVSVQAVGGEVNGGLTEFQHARSLGSGSPAAELNDGLEHTVRVVYQPGTLQVYVDDLATPLVTVAVDLENIGGRSALDSGGRAFLGIGAGTSGAYQAHEVLGWSFKGVRPPGEGSDNFAEAGTVVAEAGKIRYELFGDNIGATRESDEPPHAGRVPERSLWWNFLPRESGTYYFDTFGCQFDSLVAVYQGTELRSLTEVNSRTFRESPERGFEGSAFLSVFLQAGELYHVVVDSEDGTGGQVRLTIERGQIPPSVYLFADEVGFGGVVPNGSTVTAEFGTDNLVESVVLNLSDRGTLLFSRSLQEVNGTRQAYRWFQAPVGNHQFELRSGTTLLATFPFTVAPRELGFGAVQGLNSFAAGGGTSLTFTLPVSNHTAAAAGRLRVRLVLASTHQLRGSASPNFAALDDQVLAAFSPAVLVTLGSGQGWTVPVSDPVFCPNFEGGGSEDGLQYHIDALLEEETAGRWLVVDRLRVFSSPPEPLFPPNEGVTGSQGGRDLSQFLFLVGLTAEGPDAVDEGGQGMFIAKASLSDSTTNTVAAEWSVTPPASIDALGFLTTGGLTQDTPVTVTARYSRTIQTLVASRSVTLRNAMDAPPQIGGARLAGGNFMFDLTGLARTVYRVFGSVDLMQKTFLMTVTTDDTGHATVVVPATGEYRYFQAAP